MVMNNGKQIKRRTYLQDRFEILMRRQKAGEATFSELTELDDMVNRYPDIRDMIIREDMLMDGTDGFNEPANELKLSENTVMQEVKRPGLLSRLKSFIARIFTSQFSVAKPGKFSVSKELMMLC
jgi:hypothetical protein